ncbi:MAG: hypothetical protein ACJA16_004673 [Akkermansiaceae bacterium]|jgi:hypothetical protein
MNHPPPSYLTLILLWLFSPSFLLADVILTFDTPHVRLDWGTLTKNDTGFPAPITAHRIPVPVVPVKIITADAVADGSHLPIGILPPFEPRFTHTYRLGALQAGTYILAAQVNDIFEGRKAFTIPVDPPIDTDAPTAELTTRTITEPNPDPHQFSVTYSDSSGVDVTTLGDSDLIVLSPCIHHPILVADLCPSDWKAQRARLVNIVPLDRRMMKVRAIYEVEPPSGGWRARNNGFYPVILQADEVCDQVKNCNRYQRLGGFEVAIDIVEPPIEARTEMRIDHRNSSETTGIVKIRFASSYAITLQELQREGNHFLFIATALPTPGAPGFTPGEVTLRYPLGDLPEGDYTATFVMNGYPYARTAWEEESETFKARVDVEVTEGDDGNWKAHARIEFENPQVRITDPGEVTVNGNVLMINATAVLSLTLDAPGPSEFTYDLGQLSAGSKWLKFFINDHQEDHANFIVPAVCEPLPHLASIRTGEEEGQWFSKVALALTPDQQVLDWGTVRQSGNEFHVNLTVVCQDSGILPVPVDPVPINELPEGFLLDPEGRPNIGGSPVRLVSHLYRLGELEGGAYKFFVHSRSQTIGCHRFLVDGAPPKVELNISPITEATAEHRFGISFSDRSGLNHDSIQDAKVWIIGPDHFREEAALRSYASTDDFPSTSGFARYSVNGPDGSWDRPDNGGYRIFIEAEKVRDDDGRSHLGLRYRRLTGAEGVTQRVQASSTLNTWDDVSESVDLVERTLDIDGTEVVTLCLRETLATTKYRYLRLALEETE